MREIASQLVKKIHEGSISPMKHLTEIFAELDRRDKELNAYITVSRENALDIARDAEDRADDGQEGKLSGLALALKDNISTSGLRTTCGSMMLDDYIPPYDANVVSLLKKEGAIIIGKTNMDEFGMGSSTEFSAFGPSKNPHDIERVPGGSSGGSAVAVATGMADMALGSDTGGSIRCPASFCGVVGLKPTYGLVSRFGLIAYGNSLEQIGPITRSVGDCALLLNCITSYDSRDSTSVRNEQKDYASYLEPDLTGMKIGVPRLFFGPGTDENVSKKVWKSIENLKDEGAEVQEFDLSLLNNALSSYYVIAMSEASSNLARFDGLRYGLQMSKGIRNWSDLFSLDRRNGFGPEVKRRIILGTFALSAGYMDEYYLKAQKVRTLVKNEFERAFKRFDIMLGPTMPTLPFKLGEKTEDPITMYMCDVDTVPANLTGFPAITIPCGSSGSLPIGLQVIAPPFREDLLIGTGSVVERRSGWVI